MPDGWHENATLEYHETAHGGCIQFGNSFDCSWSGSRRVSLTPTQRATWESVDSEISPVSSIAPEGWGPEDGGNATSPLHSRRSPTKETKSELKTYARGRNQNWLPHPCLLGGPQLGGNAT